MPIDIVWDDPEQAVVRLDFTDPWDWADYQTAVMDTIRLIEPVPHPVAVIVCATTINRLPSGAITHFREVDCLVLDNLGSITVVTTQPLVKLLLNTLGKVAPRIGSRLHFASTLEEAYRQLSHQAGGAA